jgi:hypothetical protein
MPPLLAETPFSPENFLFYPARDGRFTSRESGYTPHALWCRRRSTFPESDSDARVYDICRKLLARFSQKYGDFCGIRMLDT